MRDRVEYSLPISQVVLLVLLMLAAGWIMTVDAFKVGQIIGMIWCYFERVI